MPRQAFLLPLVILLALTSAAYAAPKTHQNQTASFGIFEIISCTTPGSKSKELKTDEGKLEVYCIAAAPIITRTHVKKVESCHRKRGYEVDVDLAEDGARLMEKATRRISEEREAKGQSTRLGVVIDGKLLSAPWVHGVIRDRFVLNDGVTQEEAETLVKALGGNMKCSSISIDYIISVIGR